MNSAPFLGMISQLPTLQTVNYSGKLPPWKGQRFFLLKWTFTLDIDLSSLHTMFLPKLPPVDLQNASSMVMVLHTRCFWSRSSLHSKWSKHMGLLLRSGAQSCPNICHSLHCSTPGFSVLHYLHGLAQVHVPWVGDCYPTISSSASLFSFRL